MNKLLHIFLSFLMIFQILCISAHMQPIKKDGRYYYSQKDTHEHINLKKALLFLGKKMISPRQWIKAISSKFYPADKPKHKSDAIKMLNPTQMTPECFSIEPKIVWIGHSSFLLQINGLNILTDPIFGDVKVGPLSLTKRAMPSGIKLEDLPPIDAIVISHNHSDHTDRNTLMYLSRKYDPKIFVPEGDTKLFKSFGFSHVSENTWWDKRVISKDGRTLTLTFLPAYHWSIRFSLGGYRKSLWGSWMISTDNTNIYFAGDTAYGPHFKEIKQDFPSIDIALMPIGPTNEGENKHKHSHVDAQEAVDAFIDLGARRFIPMHYGTFFLSKDTLEYPVNKLKSYWEEKKNKLKDKELIFAQCGKQYSFDKE